MSLLASSYLEFKICATPNEKRNKPPQETLQARKTTIKRYVCCNDRTNTSNKCTLYTLGVGLK